MGAKYPGCVPVADLIASIVLSFKGPLWGKDGKCPVPVSRTDILDSHSVHMRLGSGLPSTDDSVPYKVAQQKLTGLNRSVSLSEARVRSIIVRVCPMHTWYANVYPDDITISAMSLFLCW